MPCTPNPCSNGGTCIAVGTSSSSSFMCSCPANCAGYTCGTCSGVTTTTIPTTTGSKPNYYD